MSYLCRDLLPIFILFIIDILEEIAVGGGHDTDSELMSFG